VYETEPLGRAEQPRFLNACCVGRTSVPAHEVLERCRALERAAGREPGGPRWGPRRLDIDLLLYGTEAIDRAGLRVPHPRMTERAFVLVPLSEVAGGWRHPTSGRTVAELADRVSREGVEPFGPGWG
jgi:2-amino-4-hydroxy-6-hydroxymethyldihydropteridine diphosphokinase